MSTEKRDINADYKAAYLYEYDNAMRAGRDDEAATVAEILRSAYGVDVDAADDTTDAEPEPAAEASEGAAVPEPEPAPEPVAEEAEGKPEEPRQKRKYTRRQPLERADQKAPETAVEDE